MKPGSRAWKKDVLLGAAEQLDNFRRDDYFYWSCCEVIRSQCFAGCLNEDPLIGEFSEFFDKSIETYWWGWFNDTTQQERVIALLLFRASL